MADAPPIPSSDNLRLNCQTIPFECTDVAGEFKVSVNCGITVRQAIAIMMFCVEQLLKVMPAEQFFKSFNQSVHFIINRTQEPQEKQLIVPASVVPNLTNKEILK